MSDTTAMLTRWACEACGESYASQEAAWVERMRSDHHCPTPDEITRALKGEYDG